MTKSDILCVLNEPHDTDIEIQALSKKLHYMP